VHLNWVSIFLGFHAFGMYIHNDTLLALGREVFGLFPPGDGPGRGGTCQVSSRGRVDIGLHLGGSCRRCD